MSKRILSSFVACCLVLCLFSLSGCTESPAPSAAATGVSAEGESQTAEKKDVKLKFATYQAGDVAQDWETVQLKKYKEETGVEVEHVFVNHEDTITTYMTWAAADTLPDAAMLSANYLNALIEKKMILNLTKFTGEKDPDYDFDRYFPNLLNAYKYKDEIYALPSDLDLGLLWYNKDIFDAAKLDYPNPDWTWTDLQENAKLLSSGSGPEKVYGVNLGSYQSYLWQNGTDTISADGTECLMNADATKEAFQYMLDMVQKDGSAVNPSSEEPLFQNGKAAMSLGAGPWFAHYEMENVDFNWGVTAVPTGKEKATTCFGSTFAVFQNSKQPQEALDFITWFLSDEQQMDRATKFYWFPPSTTCLNMEEFLNDDKVMGMTKAQKELVLSETKHGRAPTVVESQNELSQIMTRELSLMWAGEKSLDDALNQITEECNALLKK